MSGSDHTSRGSAVRRDLIVGLILIACAAMIPFLFPVRYVITQVTLFFIYAIVVSQWNLVLGVAGIFSLAQMALFACGGYVTAMLGLYMDWSLWAAMPVGAICAVVMSTVIGLACLRLHGPYVALLTLAIAQVMYLLITTDTECFVKTATRCEPFSGGTSGLRRFGDLGFRKLLGRDWIIANYFVGLGLLVLAMVFSAAITRGRLGLAFRALRDNLGYARSRGISQFKYQLMVFALSAFFTGFAGAFYAAHFKSIGPTVFSFTLLLMLLAMIVVGGIGTVWGPIVGAVIIMLVDEGLREFQDYRTMGLGLILAVFVLFLPKGVVGALETLFRRNPGNTDS